MRRSLSGAVGVAVLAFSPCAVAGTASIDGNGNAFYVAAAGEMNHVIAAHDPAGVRIVELGAPIVAGTGCAAEGPTEVICRTRIRNDHPFTVVRVNVGDLNDFVLVTGPFRALEQGGGGSDILNNAAVESFMSGGPDEDRLVGSGGLDRLRGGLGDDVLRGGAGDADDTADYSERTAAVRVDLDGAADDGEPGEADTLIGIEVVAGGAGDDHLTGNERRNGFLGGGGADIINGLGGEDGLVGGAGADTLNAGPGPGDALGGPGNDVLSGGASSFDFLDGGEGNDLIRAGAGGDILVGGKGNDVLGGGPGNDELRDPFGGRDVLDGGADRDAVLGGPGNDRLRGGGGPDFVLAGPGHDILRGGPGGDDMFGGAGRDTLFARDQTRDRLRGGPGSDGAEVDRGLDQLGDIELLF